MVVGALPLPGSSETSTVDVAADRVAKGADVTEAVASSVRRIQEICGRTAGRCRILVHRFLKHPDVRSAMHKLGLLSANHDFGLFGNMYDPRYTRKLRKTKPR
jgi:hypothetical protein